MTKKKILVTGASGVLGQNLVDYLLQKGYRDIVMFDIIPPKKQFGLKFMQADIADIESLSSIPRDIDFVVHCASAAPSYSEKMIYRIVLEGTSNILRHSCQSAVKRFIYISSTAVYGIPDKVPLYEDSELQDYHDPYNRAKIKAEAICDEYRAKGLCTTILRPRTFLGPGRMGTFTMLNEWALEGRSFPLLGSGKNRYQFLDVEDLCQAIYLSLVADDRFANDTYNIGAKHFGTIKDDYQSVLDAAGFGKKIIMIPQFLALSILRILDRLKLVPLYKRLYEKIVMDYYVSIEKAEKNLGYRPKYSNSESMVRCFNWYKSNHESYKNVSGAANNVPWKQGVIRYVKFIF